MPPFSSAPGTPKRKQYGMKPTGLFPRRPTEEIISIFASGHGFAKQDLPATQTDDTSDFVCGSQSLSFTTDGTGNNLRTRLNPLGAAISIVGKNLKIVSKITNLANMTSAGSFGIILFCNGNTADSYTWTVQSGTNTFPMLQEGIWTPLTLNLGNAGITGTPNPANITGIQINLKDGGSAPVTLHINEIAFVPNDAAMFPKGAIVIGFDDGWRSQYTLGNPVLTKYGVPGTFWIIKDLIDNNATYMTSAMLRQLRDVNHHEIGAHAYTLANHNLNFVNLLSQSGVGALENELVSLKTWLIENGFGDGADTLALPNGAYNKTADGTASVYSVAKKYFRLVRTIYNSTRETSPPGDTFAIRALSGISSFTGGTSIATVEGRIDSIVANQGVGILVFHDIVASNPTATTQCLQSDLDTLVAYAKASGAELMTFGDLSRRMDSWTAPLATSIPSSSSATAPSAGSAFSAAHADHSHPRIDWAPVDFGLLAYAFDPATAVNSSALGTAGTMYVVKLHNPVAQNITNINCYVVTAGATLTSGQCFGAIYQNGSLLGITADQSTAWTSVGNKSMAIAGGPVAVAAGDVYVAFWFNGTTGPALARAAGTAVGNLGITGTSSRFGVANTSITTTAPNTLGAISQYSLGYWAGIS